MEGWDSQRMIGDVEKSFRYFQARRKIQGQDPEWIAYYNGWLEGRGDMLMQMEPGLNKDLNDRTFVKTTDCKMSR